MSENVRLQLERLPSLLAPHLLLTIVALIAGVAISIPLAVLIVRRASLRFPALTAAGVVQTIPSLALLALMVPLLEVSRGLGVGIEPFGFGPAVIALTCYSVLPILRNTVTGILGVDPALIEAARGMGMTDRQRLWRVELPLAAPVIIAGIRTATVWTVGIATLATPVGQRCLGNYIFTGLQTRNWTMVMFGVVAAAATAVVLDSLIATLQRSVELNRRGLAMASAGAMAGLLLIGVSSPAWSAWLTATDRQAPPVAADIAQTADRLGTIRIGAKTFTEQYLLAELLQETLRDAGFETEKVEGLGSTIGFDQLAQGSLDVFVDYSGTVWANYMPPEVTRHELDRDPLLETMSYWLAREHSIRCLGSLGFENAYGLAMRRDRAAERGVTSIADLAAFAPAMRIGGDYEFFGRPEWQAIRRAYGLSFKARDSFDSTLMYGAVAGGQVDVISAFTSDGRIAAFDLVVLDDPKRAIPPYDAVLLLGPRVADEPALAAVLRQLVGAIDVERMRQANQRVDIDGRSIEEAAAWLRQAVGRTRR